MKFALEFDCDNAAFDEDPAEEIVKTLWRVAEQVRRRGLRRPGERVTIYDTNGNRIGDWSVEEED